MNIAIQGMARVTAPAPWTARAVTESVKMDHFGIPTMVRIGITARQIAVADMDLVTRLLIIMRPSRVLQQIKPA
jgi:hypothetical protein